MFYKNFKKKNVKWWLGSIACLMLFVAIGVFAYSKVRFLIRGVQVSALINHTDANSPMVQIKGSAKNAVYVTLDGREIYLHEDGTFSEEVALLPGLGVMTIHAKDKFGHVSEKKFEVVYKDTSEVAIVNK